LFGSREDTEVFQEKQNKNDFQKNYLLRCGRFFNRNLNRKLIFLLLVVWVGFSVVALVLSDFCFAVLFCFSDGWDGLDVFWGVAHI